MADIAALEARIRALEDIEAIKKLKAKYLRCCDLRLPKEMAECFAEHCVVDYDKVGVFRDRGAFIAVFEELGCRDGLIDLHHAHNPEIELTSETSATGLWELYFHTVDVDAQVARQLGGYYEDEYVKLDGAWRIQSTKFITLSLQDYTLGPDGALRTTFAAPESAPKISQ